MCREGLRLSRMRIIRAHLLLALLCLGSQAAFAQSPFMASCADDARIEAAKRQAIDSIATAFLQRMLGPNANSAFEMFSVAGKANVTPEQFNQANAIIQKMEPRDASVQHTYLIHLKGKSPG